MDAEKIKQLSELGFTIEKTESGTVWIRHGHGSRAFAQNDDVQNWSVKNIIDTMMLSVYLRGKVDGEHAMRTKLKSL